MFMLFVVHCYFLFIVVFSFKVCYSLLISLCGLSGNVHVSLINLLGERMGKSRSLVVASFNLLDRKVG